MVQNAVLTQQHGQNADAILPGPHHVLQKAEGHVVAARHLRVHHLEYRAFGGTGADRVDVRFRHFWPVGQIGGQLFHFLLEQRRVPAYGEDQLVRRPRRHLLAHPRHGSPGPVRAFRVQLLASVGLALDKKHHAGGGRDTLHVFGDLSGFVLVFRLFPGGQKAAFPDDDDAPVRHEGQRFGGGNERVGLRVGQVGQVQLLQPGGQQLRAQLAHRLLLDVFLRALHQVDGLDVSLFDLLKKRGMVHSMPPGKDRKR